ncbi:MAG: metal-binding protein [Blastocatellia bacterium]|nr:metal-binding protein [Blastocatellia bacterium]
MPSGKTHDLITYVLAVPTGAVLFLLTRNPGLTALGTGAMLFGGLMFGPDLDVKSKQYTRWGVLRWIWWPYQKFCSHRSRLSHGILFSTFFRVFYFLAIVTLFLATVLYIQNVVVLGMPSTGEQVIGVFQESLRRMLTLIHSLDRRMVLMLLIGLWWGATTHTISDFVVTTFKNASRSL